METLEDTEIWYKYELINVLIFILGLSFDKSEFQDFRSGVQKIKGYNNSSGNYRTNNQLYAG